MKKLLAALSIFSLTAYAQATVVWDQGPSTGNFNGLWINQSDGQNFADSVTFSQNTTVTGLNYFTQLNLGSQNGPQAFKLKILSDNSGIPGSVILSQDIGYSSSATVGNFFEYVFNFTQLFQANTTYWVGISGNGFEAAQASVITPQDGRMAQFDGSTYSFMTSVGDQMFQLTGDVANVPEPASLALLGLGFAALTASRRRKAQ